jgi:hypothetical protein
MLDPISNWNQRFEYLLSTLSVRAVDATVLQDLLKERCLLKER